ncbi:MAG: hypothetical protein AABX00_00305 [Nanoarchaeota archaeon]
MYESEFLTASLTIIGGVVVYITGELLNQFMIKPYYKFKESLNKLQTELMFRKSILTNMFIKEVISNEFFKEVIDIQKNLRKIWAHLNIEYKYLHKKRFFLMRKNIPTIEEMETILSNMLILSNSMIVIFQNLLPEQKNDSLERSRKVEEILSILKKY